MSSSLHATNPVDPVGQEGKDEYNTWHEHGEKTEQSALFVHEKKKSWKYLVLFRVQNTR